jgi:3-oxoacyl-(acyl-carrier-protein) synthase
MLYRNPVVTGTGIICATGCGVARVWKAVRAGQSGLGPLTIFASPRYANHLVGQVRENVDALAGNVRGSRSDKLAWIAAREALAGAGLKSGLGSLNPERTGVVLGCTVGGMLGTEQFLAGLLRDNRRRFGSLRFHECASATDLCASKLGARGPCATVSTACSAGAMAILAAVELIEQGEADLMLAGGADSLSRLTLNGFGSLLLLDPNGCRPFDARRNGISLGEGAAMLVLEAEETARARGATIFARLAGWGASCDAFHATAPHPEGRGALAAMQCALERAGLQPVGIDYVSAHGTGTPDNDAMEVKALKQLFNNRLPPVASVKRFFGHTLAASGAIKAVLCVQALREQAIPANPGFEIADAKLGLEPVREFRAQPLSRVLSNSFGFGGNNVALVLAAPAISNLKSQVSNSRRSVAAPAVANKTGFAVLGIGVTSAAGSTLAEISAAFQHGGAATTLFDVPSASPPGKARVYACGEFGAEQFLDPPTRRRVSRIQQMVITAAHRSLPASLLATTVPGRIAIAIGTGLGSLNDTAAFVENMIRKEERAPHPALFTNSVHNSLASQVAIKLNLAGLNSTAIQREISFEFALWQAATELALGRANLALAGAADELNQYMLAAGMRWGWWNESSPEIHPFAGGLNCRQRPLLGEGCAMFALGRADTTSPLLARVSAIRTGRCAVDLGGPFDAEAEARWIQETLERDGLLARDVDLLLTGANGWPPLDEACRGVAQALSRLAGRRVACGAYKQCCGEHHSASAFGFLTAIGFARGEIAPERCACTVGDAPASGACRTVVLYTLSPTGTKGMCCVCA